MDELRRNLGKILLMLLTLVVFGTVGYHIIEGWDWFDGLYMTVITITTTGYEEIHELSTGGRILSMLLMLFGVSIFFYGINLIIPSLIERGENMRRKIQKLRNHIILCGYGKFGMEIAKELKKKPLVIIENDPSKAALAKENGFLVILGDAEDERVLKAAGIKRARVLVTCMKDSTNLIVLLTARDLNPRIKTVCIVKEPKFERKLRKAGADFLLYPYRDVAKKISMGITKPAAVEFIETIMSERNVMNLEKIAVPRSYVGKTIEELNKETGCVIVAIDRKGKLILSSPHIRLEKGDKIFVIGYERGMDKIESEAKKIETREYRRPML
jgi:voltage-gated potassium channel